MTARSRSPRKPLGALPRGLAALALALPLGAGAELPKAGAARQSGSGASSAPHSAPSGSGGVEAAEASAVQISGRPKVELQHGSGDFVSFQDSVSYDGTADLRFRWKLGHPGTVSARWETKSWPTGAPGGARPTPSGSLSHVPAFGSWAPVTIDLFERRSSAGPVGPTRFELTVVGLDASGNPIGQPSLPVVVNYAPPGSGPTQTIHVDTVELLDWTPKSGVMNGPNDGNRAQYGPDQKVDLTFLIGLQSESSARLSNNLIGADGKALDGNFYTFVDLHSKGSHTKTNFVTIRCDEGLGNPYYEQVATGLRWKMWRKSDGGVLAEGAKTFSTPLVWRCPGKDQLTLASQSPMSGTIRGIGSPTDATKPGFSVVLGYQYRLNSQPKAVIKQIPLLANYQPVPNEYWTDTKVNNGAGNATNRLSVYCQSQLQPDVEVKHLRYTLAKEGSGEAILQEVVPVDWTFSCKPPVLVPAGVQQVPGLRRIGPSGAASQGREAMGRASDAMQKVAPNPAASGNPAAERMQKVVPRGLGTAPALPSAGDVQDARDRIDSNVRKKETLR